MNRCLSASLAALALAVLPGCAKNVTGIYVTVTADSTVAGQARDLVIQVFNPSTATSSTSTTISNLTASSFPLTFGVTVGNAPSRVRIDVEARGMDMRLPGMLVVRQRAIVTTRDETLLNAQISLLAACVLGPAMQPCSTEQNCTGLNQCSEALIQNPTVRAQ